MALNKTGGPHVKPPPPSALQRGLQQLMFGPTLKCSLKNAVSAGLGASVRHSGGVFGACMHACLLARMHAAVGVFFRIIGRADVDCSVCKKMRCLYS